MDTLPAELALKIIDVSPELRFASRRYYVLHNNKCKHDFLRLLPFEKTKLLEPFLRRYLRTLEFWNGALQRLVEPDFCWWIALSFLHNRKIFFQRDFASIQLDDRADMTFEDFGTISIRQARTFTYKQDILLPAGPRGYHLVLRTHRRTRGLGTMLFSLTRHTEAGEDGEEMIIRQYLPIYISEMITPNELTAVCSGSFECEPVRNGGLSRYTFKLEEQGMYTKSDLEFYYMDFKDHGSFDHYDPLFFTTSKVPELERQVHIAVELLYQDKSLETYNFPTEAWQDSLEKFYTTGTRQVRMRDPNAQRLFKESTNGTIKKWKVPF